MLPNPNINARKTLNKSSRLVFTSRFFSPLSGRIRDLMPANSTITTLNLSQALDKAPPSYSAILKALLYRFNKTGSIECGLAYIGRIAASYLGREKSYGIKTVRKAIEFYRLSGLLIKQNRKWTRSHKNQTNLYALSPVLFRSDMRQFLSGYFMSFQGYMKCISLRFLLSEAKRLLSSKWCEWKKYPLSKLYVFNYIDLTNYKGKIYNLFTNAMDDCNRWNKIFFEKLSFSSFNEFGFYKKHEALGNDELNTNEEFSVMMMRLKVLTGL